MPVITFNLNGSPVSVDADDDDALLWILRDRLGVTGPKYGCGVGVCGACTSHIDGAAQRLCVTPAAEVAGRAVTTIEGLADGDVLHPVQEAWIDEDVAQCGYCQAGQIMTAVDLLQRIPDPTDADIDEAMRENVCRCGTYFRIRTAIKRAAAAGPAAATSREVVRLGGSDRSETAALVSAATFEPGVDVAYIATAANFPDALSGGPLAASDGGPMLLTQPDALPAATAAELDRLGPGRIVVLGGPRAVSDDVVTALSEHTTGRVDRIGGESRYDTAALVSATSFPAGHEVAYIATGQNFPDALTVGPMAVQDRGPVLLVESDLLPEATRGELERIGPDRLVVIGGPAVVSDDVVAELEAIAPVTRIAGATRFDTAAAVASGFASATTAYVATAEDFPDALAGVPVAGLAGAPILLVEADGVPASVRAQLRRLNPSTVVVLGGSSAVSDAVVDAIRAL